jgi:hypothetical protein
MEAYILDDQLRRIDVIDQFESLIWTERYSAAGDFELHTLSNIEMKSKLKAGTRLVTNNTDRIMIVENSADVYDNTGKKLLKVKGPELVSILSDRVATASLTGQTSSTKWEVNDTPGNVARYVFNQICRTGLLSPNDVIPFLQTGSLYPASTISEPSTAVDMLLDLGTVYDTIKKICDVYNLGFRLVNGIDQSKLYFDIYSGDDRTTLQTVFPAVVFGVGMDNMTDITEVSDITAYKNTAYVFSQNGSQTVYSDDVTSSISGLDRRILFVSASDITDAAGAGLNAKLQQRGKDELAKHRRTQALDGTVTKYNNYVYGTDYRLGDLVEMRNSDGAINIMRVTEHIYSQDVNGEASYPTLVNDKFLTPGSWYSGAYNMAWADATTTWASA